MKIIIILGLCFLLFSCLESKEDQNMIKETNQIIDDYANILTGSIQNSKEVKDLFENNQNKLLNEINSVK